MKVPNLVRFHGMGLLSLSRLQNEGSQLKLFIVTPLFKSIKATE